MSSFLERHVILFIGGGQMAESMIQGLLNQKLAVPDQITVCDPAAERREHLSGTYHVTTTLDTASVVARADVVVLAVKPQQLAGVLGQLRGRLRADALLLSIVAGARIETMCTAVQHRLVVRAMPNTPAQVSKAATVWASTPEVTPALRERARAILGAMGMELEVTDEGYVEIATGLTGPTPAFLFLIIEALVEAGVSLGFQRDAALALTLQTIEGSVALMKQTGEHAAVLRGQVTSPGGATAAGVYVLEKAGLRATISDAVHAVFLRACELGNTIK